MKRVKINLECKGKLLSNQVKGPMKIILWVDLKTSTLYYKNDYTRPVICPVHRSPIYLKDDNTYCDICKF